MRANHPGRIAGLLLTALISAGCAGTALNRQPGTTASTPIPWINVTPTPFVPLPPSAPVIPTDMPPCKARGLVAMFGGSGALTNGQLMGSIILGNRGAAPCFLDGFAGLQLFDNKGSRIPVQVSQWMDPQPMKVLVQSGTANLTFGSQQPGTASVSFIWQTRDRVNGGPCTPPAPQGTMVRLDLPSGGSLDVPVNDPRNQVTIAPCGGGLSLGPFEAINPSVPTTPSPPQFSFEVTVPGSVVASQTLFYTVRVRNISSMSVTIRPQDTVVFAMQLHVPAGTQPGNYGLYWNFAEFGNTAAPGEAALTVTR